TCAFRSGSPVSAARTRPRMRAVPGFVYVSRGGSWGRPGTLRGGGGGACANDEGESNKRPNRNTGHLVMVTSRGHGPPTGGHYVRSGPRINHKGREGHKGQNLKFFPWCPWCPLWLVRP